MMEKFENVDERLREKCDNSRAAQTENRIKDLEDRLNAYVQGVEQRFIHDCGSPCGSAGR